MLSQTFDEKPEQDFVEALLEMMRSSCKAAASPDTSLTKSVSGFLPPDTCIAGVRCKAACTPKPDAKVLTRYVVAFSGASLLAGFEWA
ncbi:MAG: hypothetical protein HQ446_09830 [Polaromonas sp.]|nr:hypothetical protein [Polaromonas sp.]